MNFSSFRFTIRHQGVFVTRSSIITDTPMRLADVHCGYRVHELGIGLAVGEERSEDALGYVISQ